jgi:hypothetical protein
VVLSVVLEAAGTIAENLRGTLVNMKLREGKLVIKKDMGGRFEILEDMGGRLNICRIYIYIEYPRA